MALMVQPPLQGEDDAQAEALFKEARRRARRRRLTALTAVGMVIGTAVGVAVGVGGRPPAPQPAVTNTNIHPVPDPPNGEYLRSSFSVGLLETLTAERRSVQATVTGPVQMWSNNSRQDCIAASFSIQFASPSAQAAWLAAGGLMGTSGIPPLACNSVNSYFGAGSDSGVGVLNVGSLSTNPTTLARQLIGGTTGIPALDRAFVWSEGRRGFDRPLQIAQLILVGPTIGAKPGFYVALLKALSSIPTVHRSSADLSTHAGQVGIGFSGSSPIGKETLILDPQTGRLLEAQNIVDDLAIPSHAFMGRAVYNPPTARVEWFDPTGISTVVDSSAVPAGLTALLGMPPGSRIEMIVKPGRLNEVDSLAFDKRYLQGLASQSGFGEPGPNGFQKDILFYGSQAQEDALVTRLQQTGLFSSVIELNVIPPFSPRY
jgi:hypothetical protein